MAPEITNFDLFPLNLTSSLYRVYHSKAQDILSLDCRRKKAELTINIQKEYSNDGLPSSWIQYKQTLDTHSPSSLYSFCIYGNWYARFFSACSPGLLLYIFRRTLSLGANPLPNPSCFSISITVFQLNIIILFLQRKGQYENWIIFSFVISPEVVDPLYCGEAKTFHR